MLRLMSQTLAKLLLSLRFSLYLGQVAGLQLSCPRLAGTAM